MIHVCFLPSRLYVSMLGSRNFLRSVYVCVCVGGGGGGELDVGPDRLTERKLAFYFSLLVFLNYLVLNLFCRGGPMIAIQRILSLNYNVSNIPGRRAIRHFSGWSNFIRGSNCLFLYKPIELVITRGGSGPPAPLWILAWHR